MASIINFISSDGKKVVIKEEDIAGQSTSIDQLLKDHKKKGDAVMCMSNLPTATLHLLVQWCKDHKGGLTNHPRINAHSPTYSFRPLPVPAPNGEGLLGWAVP